MTQPASHQHSASRVRAGVNLANIPGELKMLPQWVTWIWTGQVNPATGKRDKLLMNPHTGTAAASNDASTWGTFDQAVQAYQRRNHAGIGFVFSDHDPYAGVDLDNCIDPFGIKPWAQEIIDALATYCEISPSGTGVKLIAVGVLPSNVGSNKKKPGLTVEMYDRLRFFTLTGNLWPNTPTTINDASQELIRLHTKLKPPTPRQAPRSAPAVITASDPRAQAWAQRVIDYACDQMRQAQPGTKHHTRVSMGRMLGGLVAHGLLSSQDAADLIYHANPPQANDSSERKAIMDGIALGVTTPLDAPDMPPSTEPLYIDGLACCPLHLTELRQSNSAGWYCPTQANGSYCDIWFDGTGYTPPAPSPPNNPPPPPVSPQPAQAFHPLLLDAPQTDAGNAECFAALYGDQFRYCRNLKMWYRWSGQQWQTEASAMALRAMLDTIRQRRAAAALLTNPDLAKALFSWTYRSEMTQRLNAALEIARNIPPFMTTIDEYDAYPMLAGVANGTLDLSSQTLRPAQQADLITQRLGVAYDPTADCPRWRQFLTEIFSNDTDLIAYIQRAIGYSLTGSIRESKMFILSGEGNNGKSIFLGIIKQLLGNYAATAAFSTFDAERRNEATNDLAALKGKRFVLISESNSDRKLDEGRVKQLTGFEDDVRCRFLYKEEFEYRPECKIWMAVNHLPMVRNMDLGIWRRLVRVLFLQDFTGREDFDLPEKLKTELPGILNWALDGLRAWRASGLGSCSAIETATAAYRQASDIAGEFLDEHCINDPMSLISACDLYETFYLWSKNRGEQKPMSYVAFGRILNSKGYTSQRSVKDAKKQTFYAGLRRRQELDP